MEFPRRSRWRIDLATADLHLEVQCPGDQLFEAWLIPSGMTREHPREYPGVLSPWHRVALSPWHRTRAFQSAPDKPFVAHFEGLSPFEGYAVQVKLDRARRGPCTASSKLRTSKVRLLGGNVGALAIALSGWGAQQRWARILLATVFVTVLGAVVSARWTVRRVLQYHGRPWYVGLMAFSVLTIPIGTTEFWKLIGLRENFGRGDWMDHIILLVLGFYVFVGFGAAVLFEERLSTREGVAAIKVAAQCSGLALLTVSFRMLWVTGVIAAVSVSVDHLWDVRAWLWLEILRWWRAEPPKKTVRILTPSMRPPAPMTPSSLVASQRARQRGGNPLEERPGEGGGGPEPAGSNEGGTGAGTGARAGSGARRGATPGARARLGGKIFNFETGRTITVGGSTYKRLLREGYEVDLENGLIKNPKPRSFSLEGAASD